MAKISNHGASNSESQESINWDQNKSQLTLNPMYWADDDPSVLLSKNEAGFEAEIGIIEALVWDS